MNEVKQTSWRNLLDKAGISTLDLTSKEVRVAHKGLFLGAALGMSKFETQDLVRSYLRVWRAERAYLETLGLPVRLAD